MSDIFREVDEEVRRDQFKQLWDRYGIIAIVAAVLVVVAVGGWRGYQWWQSNMAAEAGATYDLAADLETQGKTAEAEAAFTKLATDGTSGYRVLARFRAASTEPDPKAAVTAYDAISRDSSVSKLLQDFATLRAGLLLVDTAPLAEMTQRLEPLAGAKGAFRHTARELLALSAIRASDTAAAKRWLDEMIADAETPQSVRARVEVLMTLNEGSKS
ncbi:MAG: tetratricopeptide repeat protein [Xanthobacteraceae bacterium]